MDAQHQPAVATPPPPPPAAAPPAAAAPVATPPPAVAPPAAPPATEPAKPVAAAPAVQPPAPEQQPPEVVQPPAAPAEIELKLPEGAAYDPTAIGEAKKIFADQKTTPAQKMQALIDLDQKTHKARAEAFKQQVEQLRTKDIETLKSDKDYGGAKYQQTVDASRGAMRLSKHGEAVGKLLTSSGLDNHPDMVRFLADVRSLVAEDPTKPPAGTPAPDPKQKLTTQTQRLAGIYSDPKANGGKK